MRMNKLSDESFLFYEIVVVVKHTFAKMIWNNEIANIKKKNANCKDFFLFFLMGKVC